ncbi:hypothetical protein VE04_03607 [Pseudogymnoascus sp. 24MN13]|nr:hypothetical protein VE04_03607 [Pseudogymnoascus sp. 24MN13]
MVDPTPATELQPMLSRDSPRRNDNIPRLPSLAASEVPSHVSSDVAFRVSPPETVLAGVVLQIVVELNGHGLDRQDVRAIATLFSHTGEGKLDGSAVESGHHVSPIKMEFYFAIAFTDPGIYHLGIHLEETLFCVSYGHINTENITVTKVEDDGQSTDTSDGGAKRGDETLETYRTVNIVNDSDLQPESTPDETTEKERLSPPLPRKELGSTTQISSAIYSGQSLDILQKLWGARLCAGMKDEAVKGAFKKVHGQIPPEHHELLCRVAWLFQADKMYILSPPWEEFYRFAFGQESEIEKGRVFGQLLENWSSISNGKRTEEEITTDWQHI